MGNGKTEMENENGEWKIENAKIENGKYKMQNWKMENRRMENVE